MALITLVDEERQWIKSRLGLEVEETPREYAFCAHTILDDRIMTVADATRDDRFHDNPYVTGDPHIRFYAGAPLRTDSGHGLGALCVLDREPRELVGWQEEVLNSLSRQVVRLLEQRKVTRRLAETLAQIKILGEMVPVCAWCGTARDEEGYWGELEEYVERFAAARVSHGICPGCAARVNEELEQE